MKLTAPIAYSLLLVTLAVAPCANARPWTYRFAYNYCTLSYTFAFYGEPEWTAEIGHLKNAGFNCAAVEAGLAAVWQETLKDLGATDAQIAAFLPDTAARAWWCMGNLEGLGGPLSQNEIVQDAMLGRKIVLEMKKRGIEPVFQGFAGLVPHDFADYGAKGAPVLPQGKWCGFTRPAVLDPTSPRFAEVAKIWYRNLEKVYGVRPKFFGCDLFHEGGSSKGIDVTEAATCVQNEMIAAGGKDAVWFIQSWWKNPPEALLKGLNPKNAVILLLVKDMANGSDPAKLRGFGDIPWIWCELSNFGGKSGLYGGIPMLCQFDRVINSPKGKTLVGMGMLSEGVGTNPLWYEFFYEVMRSGDRMKRIDRAVLERWVANYAKKRYGSDNPKFPEALMLLVDSVYSPTQMQEGPSENILCAKPAWELKRASSWGTARRYWDPAKVRQAAATFEEAVASLKADRTRITKVQAANVRYDRSDILRQVLQDELTDLLPKCKDSAAARNEFLAKIRDTDRLLELVPEMNYVTYQAMAERWGGEKAKTALQRMLTDWSGRPDELDDYAQRQWSGLIRDYYLPRWEKFFEAAR